MLRLLRNRRLWLGLILVGGLAAVALWPKTVAVDLAPVGRGPLMVTIDEEGETRVRRRFIVSAPLAGRVLRIELEPGDRVKRGDVVARLRPEAPPMLDARARAEARAMVDTARATLSRMRAEEQRVNALLAQTDRELERTRAYRHRGRDGHDHAQQRQVIRGETRLAQRLPDGAHDLFHLDAKATVKHRLQPTSPSMSGFVSTRHSTIAPSTASTSTSPRLSGGSSAL